MLLADIEITPAWSGQAIFHIVSFMMLHPLRSEEFLSA